MLKKYFLDNFLFLSFCGAVFSAFFQIAAAEKLSAKILMINFGLIWSYYVFLNRKIPGIKNKNSLLIVPILLLSFFYHDLEKESVLLYLVLGVLALNYPKNTLWEGFRSVKYIKAFFIAFVWSSVVVLPLYSEKILLEWQILAFLWSIVYCIVLVVALLFDIKDQKTDFGKTHTIPTQFGLSKTKRVAVSFLLLALVFLLFRFLQSHFSIQFFYSILSCLLYLLVMVFLSNPKKSEIFYLLWVEGALLLPFLAYVLMAA